MPDFFLSDVFFVFLEDIYSWPANEFPEDIMNFWETEQLVNLIAFHDGKNWPMHGPWLGISDQVNVGEHYTMYRTNMFKWDPKTLNVWYILGCAHAQ